MLLILSQTLWSVNAKIVQTESRISSLLECFAEVQPILCKDCANRMQSSVLELLRCSQSSAKIVQTESRTSSLIEYFAEVQPILCKDKNIC